MRPMFGAAAVAFVAVTAIGCATITAGSFSQPGLDFTKYRTYAWGRADALPAPDPRLMNNASFRDRLEGAVEKELSRRGIAAAGKGARPDLLIHYHASTSERIDVNRVDREHGYCYDEACNARVIEYEAGTLILDVTDGRSNRLVWRGWAQDNLDALVDDPDKMARTIERSVAKMFERSPFASRRVAN